jgi:sortase (surface protein transpeptidase)
MDIRSVSDLFDALWLRKVSFVVVFFIVFLVSYAILAALDFLPEPPSGADTVAPDTRDEETVGVAVATGVSDMVASVVTAFDALTTSTLVTEIPVSVEEPVPPAVPAAAPAPVIESVIVTATEVPVVPVSLTIPKLGRTVEVRNPVSRTIADLDAALLTGVVRHPDSARLDQEGNVFILGHSSYLPVVTNRNFQAFNGIQNLAWGDVLVVTADDGQQYTYRVERVYRARAQEVVVPIAGTGHRLTLATCNSFGSADDRYIVEAVRLSV